MNRTSTGGIVGGRRRADPAQVLQALHEHPVPSWTTAAKKMVLNPRNAVMAALLLTYIWRFHDLAPPLRPLRIAAIATVSSWAFLVLAPRLSVLGRVLRYPYVWLYLVWSLWLGVSVPSALNVDWAWTVWSEAHLKTVSMFLFLLGAVTSYAVLRSVMLVHVFGAAIMAFFYAKGGFSQVVTPVPGFDRNNLALALNFSLPFALYLALQAERRWERVGFWAISVGIATSVLMSQSRGGFLTLAVVLGFMLVRVEGLSLRTRVLPIFLFLGSLFFLPQHIQDRLASILRPSEDYNLTTETGRVAVWKRGLGYFGERPVLGVGIKNFPVAEARLSEAARTGRDVPPKAAHNAYLEAAVEGGFPSILLYCGILVSLGWSTIRLRGRLNRARGSPHGRRLVLLADFVVLVLCGYSFGSFFLSMAYSPMLPALLALGAGLQYSADKWLRQLRLVRGSLAT